MQHFQQQKYAKAKPEFEKVVAGPGKDLADRARVHLRIIEQRMQRSEPVTPRTPEEHYQQGVAMMNMGRWDEAREHLVRARKLAPKADYVIYAMAALDCLTGEAESAMENLKLAIQLRPENRYHARNDEDFAFLQEDPQIYGTSLSRSRRLWRLTGSRACIVHRFGAPVLCALLPSAAALAFPCCCAG